ncbi:glycoside hydrolase family 3 C-terminal domain-containing protein [Lactobacillus psittaci]|uniref:Glucocerebrosidase n=1 Tax=Lactobacillus psittaci DSM 15354 TaxID=1122152 RepID=A0A0R1S255_9LACO|nr:glycoside hydrolase family 3 C-terminal domain-containing protein [Lactobacillus psittaci]KRL63116.1 glucocerebrosidase [Lactobacillus psittaci DSM 15354]
MLKNQAIIDKLTLKEKASLVSGKNEWETYSANGKVPTIFMSDGPLGLRKQSGAGDHLGLNASEKATCFPASATLANSWNPNLTKKVGQALAREAQRLHVNQVLGPALNIKRNPRGGRSFEYYSEDPYLAGKMAAGMIQGIESGGVAATPKHFAVNSQETRRMASDSVVDERTLHELYLTNFEIAVKEGKPSAIMSSYNEINGTYANENEGLLTKSLRHDWGFDGYVVTDWGGDNDHVKGLQAGNNLVMPGLSWQGAQEIVAAVEAGKLKESVLDQRVDELISVILKLKHSEKTISDFSWDEQHKIAQKAARESIVLLKNNGILPLKANTKVALIGDFAKTPRYQGAGSSLINAQNVENMLTTSKNYPLNLVGFAQGYERSGQENQALLDEAKKLAKTADVIVVNMGLDEGSESEGLDRPNLSLPANQLHLVNELSKLGKELVVVLSGGSVIELPFVDKVSALVHGYLGGEAGASAVWDVLTGKYNPSGRLSETYPLKESDILFNQDFPEKKRHAYYREGPFVGYRYFDSVNQEVLFPFGFGLSYTKFDLSNFMIDEKGVSFKVKNIGLRSGKETVQMYVGKKDSNLIRPAKELKGWIQVELRAGESKACRIKFDDKTFRFWDVADKSWQVEAGKYQVYLGENVENIAQTLTISREGITLPEITNASLVKYERLQLDQTDLTDFSQLLGHKVPENTVKELLDYNDPLSDMHHAKSGLARIAANYLKKKINQSIVAGKPDLNFLFNYNMPFRAMPKMTHGMVSKAMAEDILTIVNGHFFKGCGRLIGDYFKNRKLTKANSWYQEGE